MRLRRVAGLGMRCVRYVVTVVALAVTCLCCVLVRKRRDTLVWGVTPLINYKYWSAAMRAMGEKSVTLVTHHYPIHSRADFDLYLSDLVPAWVPRTAFISALAQRCCGLLFVFRNASVLHLDFRGGLLGDTPLCRWEGPLLRLAGIKTIVMPYGSDAQPYSRYDPAVRHALLSSYPKLAEEEAVIQERIFYWSKWADIVLCGFMVDGLPRWDVPVANMLTIDIDAWKAKTAYSPHDGRNGVVRVLHAPNHRGVKGTEFIQKAVQDLRAEGLEVELILLERVSNEEVRQRMQQADILADQLILPGYGLAAIEGMASGLPVIANLDSEAHTRVFRRYAFLNECPILSTTPENVLPNLRALVTNPALREQLGRAGRKYAEKYYSYRAAQYLFGSIYRKLLRGESIDLINLYHPLRSEFTAANPVSHPLVENRLVAADDQAVTRTGCAQA